MTDKRLLSLSKRLARDKTLTTEHESTELAQLRETNRLAMLSELKNIGKSGSLETIVAAEKSIVKFELKEYANSKNYDVQPDHGAKRTGSHRNKYRFGRRPEAIQGNQHVPCAAQGTGLKRFATG